MNAYQSPAIAEIAGFADHLIEALSPPGGSTPGGELSRLLADPSPIGTDDALLAAAMVELTRVLNLSTTALAGVTHAADRAGLPRRKRLRTAVDMLTGLSIAPAVAHRLARVGRAAASLPALMRRARTGELSIEHIDAVGRGVAFVDRRVPLDADRRADLAHQLTAQNTPADVDHRARELALAWAPETDPADPDSIPIAENTALNEMTLGTGPDGRTIGALDLDSLTGEALHQALDALCKPVPQPDGSPDARSASQRRADALGHIIGDYLAGRDRPTSGGVLPHVTMIVPTAPESHPDRAHADLVHADRAHRPDSHAASVASLGFTGPISAATVGLIICEAAMRRVVLDPESAPLDVGREHRLVTVALRKALEARDRGCAFPGCGRPISWTDAHHCVPWSEGGDTTVDNCVLLCRMHHTLIHHTGWEVFIGHDRHPWFRPPVGPEHPQRFREPLRSHHRRTLTADLTAAA